MRDTRSAGISALCSGQIRSSLRQHRRCKYHAQALLTMKRLAVEILTYAQPP